MAATETATEKAKETPTYRILLWDHEQDPNGFDGWSLALAEQWLEGRANGLTLPEVGRALRYLRQWWSDEVILIEREDRVLVLSAEYEEIASDGQRTLF